MKNFIILQWPSIVIIAAFLFYIGYLVITRKWQELRATAYALIMQAERIITGTKRGQERFEVVFKDVYSLIPAWLRFWFPEYLVREKLQDWYNHIKDYLDNGSMDNSVK